MAGHHKDFELLYSLHERVGEGQDGEVYRATNRISGKVFAVKIVTLPREVDEEAKTLREEIKGHVNTEIEVLRDVAHRNIIRLLEVYTMGDTYYMVLDYCNGGTLLDSIQGSDVGRPQLYEEPEAKKVIYALARAVEHLHSRGVAHRDLKPDNVFLRKGSRTSLKLGDFGLAGDLAKGPMTDAAGSLHYVAPEVLLCKEGRITSYGEGCDVWSLGVTLYVLLSGLPPFNGDTPEALFSSIKAGIYYFPVKPFALVSKECKDLIRSMLTRDPAERSTVEEVIAHPWLKALADEDARIARWKSEWGAMAAKHASSGSTSSSSPSRAPSRGGAPSPAPSRDAGRTDRAGTDRPPQRQAAAEVPRAMTSGGAGAQVVVDLGLAHRAGEAAGRGSGAAAALRGSLEQMRGSLEQIGSRERVVGSREGIAQ